MSATTPEWRVAAPYGAVKISRSVRGEEWIEAARLQCWLAGRGSMDVPAHAPLVTISGGASATFRYWTKPRYQTTRYAYGFTLRGASRGEATVTIPSGGTAYATTIGTRDDPQPMTIPIGRSAQSLAEAELSFDIAAPAGLDVTVECVSIEALPRMFLDTAGSDLGVERTRFFARRPIAVASLGTQLLARQNDLRDACRRVGAFQFARGDGSPWSVTTDSPSWATLFDAAIGILGRKLYSTDTTRTLSWRVLAKCSDGTTSGSVRVNNDSGTGASTITIPTGTTTYTWLPTTAGAAATFSADAEDNTTATGLRGGAHDDHTFEAQRTAGAGTISIATISIFEA